VKESTIFRGTHKNVTYIINRFEAKLFTDALQCHFKNAWAHEGAE